MESLHTLSEQPAADLEEPAGNILHHATGWFASLRSRIEIGTELALAEAKLAAMSFAFMTFLGIIAAVLFLSAWGLAIAGLVIAVLKAGIALWIIMLTLAAVHLAGAIILAYRLAAVSKNMNFTATRAFVQRQSDQVDP